MAIFQPTPELPTSKVIDRNLFLLSATKSNTVQLSNNNRSGSKQGSAATAVAGNPEFQGMDNLILSLDATFDLLANQADWDSYASAQSGLWELCANCQPDYGGKKFFRQANFNRSLIGLPQLSSPTFDGPPTSGGGVTLEWDSEVAPPPSLYFPATVSLWDGWAILQLGKVMLNPVLPVSRSDVDQIYVPGDAQYERWLPFRGDAPIELCSMDGEGQPGLSGNLVNIVG